MRLLEATKFRQDVVEKNESRTLLKLQVLLIPACFVIIELNAVNTENVSCSACISKLVDLDSTTKMVSRTDMSLIEVSY